MNIVAPHTEEDRILIRILRVEKEYNALQMLIEFPYRKWNKYALHQLIYQNDATGTSNSRNTVVANVLPRRIVHVIRLPI